MLDFHVHLARLSSPEEISKELLRHGYSARIVACEPWEWERTESLLPIWRESATPCFGIHPMIAGAFDERQIDALKRFLEKHPKALVGECGIDKRFPGYGPGDFQERTFRIQARMAMEFNRPLMIHAVGDHRRLLKILEEEGFSASGPHPIFHRFGGDRETVNRALGLNAIISLHRDSFRKRRTREALSLIPKDRVRFETDADERLFPMTAKSLLDQLQEVSDLFYRSQNLADGR